MILSSGTSGFSYPGWRGTFYAERLPEAEMLPAYAARLSTVEINNTFYRMPQPALLEGWRRKVEGDFCFALKAPRSLTHVARLASSAREGTRLFIETARTLGPLLGPLLFQLPPFARKDVPTLRTFLAALPRDIKAAFEFRHPSWFEPEVYDALGEHGAALVGGDPDEGERLPLVKTANFTYLRLRRPSYDLAELGAWQLRIAALGCERAFVYLKHEVLGPLYAEALQALWYGKVPNELPAAAPPASPSAPATESPQKAAPKARGRAAAKLKAEKTAPAVRKPAATVKRRVKSPKSKPTP